jgi:spermidine synthase
VALRRRGSVLELVVAGVFALDTVDTSTELELARAALAGHRAPARVLVGGLGLGFTAREVLADPRVRHLDVVELAAPQVEWARCGAVPELAGIEDGDRCRLWVADVADALAGRVDGLPRGWDLVLLDVDNGPGYLVHEGNEAVYEEQFLRQCRELLGPGGVLVIWSANAAPDLLAAMRGVFGDAEAQAHDVLLQERPEQYYLYLARR